jgi:hypothetical protein
MPRRFKGMGMREAEMILGMQATNLEVLLAIRKCEGDEDEHDKVLNYDQRDIGRHHTCKLVFERVTAVGIHFQARMNLLQLW